VTGALSTAGWPLGPPHLLRARRDNRSATRGPVGAVFIDVVVPVELIDFAVE
jgi:hypothetical protein